MKTINKVFLLLLVSLVSSPLFAEIDTFVQKVTGAGSLAAAIQASDGGFVTTTRIDNTSFLVRKIKISGQKEWERRLSLDAADNNFDRIDGLAQTMEGGFVLAGQICLDQSCSATLVKLRPNGTVAWKKSIAVSGESSPDFSSVIAMPDGGFIAIGTVEAIATRFLVARFTATGDVIWGKSFGDFDTYYGRLFFEVTADKGLILAFTTQFTGNDVHVLKFTYTGTVAWEKFLTTDSFGFQSLGTTAENGVILVGSSTNSNKLFVVVLKADGTFSWKAGYSMNVPSASISSVSSPVRTPDGGYVLTGITRSGRGFIAKIDSSRKVAFQNTFGERLQPGSSVFATANGGLFLFGATFTGSNLLLLKMNSEGIVPGCSFFQSLGRSTRIPFGASKIGPVTVTTLNDVSLEPVNFGLPSVVTNYPISTVCQ